MGSVDSVFNYVHHYRLLLFREAIISQVSR
jgi:hypothetical protein